MTVHASLCCGHGCKCCALNGVVAIATIHSKLPDMQRMTIWNWLRGLIAGINCFRTESVCDNECRIQRKDRASHQDEWQDCIGPTGEKESAHVCLTDFVGGLFWGCSGVVLGLFWGCSGILRAFFHKLFRILNNRSDAVSAQGFTKVGNAINSRLVNASQKIKIASASARTDCDEHHDILSQIALRVHQTILPNFPHHALTTALNKRELINFTSTPEGVALPHAIRDEIEPNASGIVLFTLLRSILWGSHQVQIVVGLFGSTAQPWVHVRSLARIARVCSQDNMRQQLIACADDVALLNLFDKECNNDV